MHESGASMGFRQLDDVKEEREHFTLEGEMDGLGHKGVVVGGGPAVRCKV